MNTSEASLAPYRKHSGIPFQVLPARNPLSAAVPFIKLISAALMGGMVVLMLLEVGR